MQTPTNPSTNILPTPTAPGRRPLYFQCIDIKDPCGESWIYRPVFERGWEVPLMNFWKQAQNTQYNLVTLTVESDKTDLAHMMTEICDYDRYLDEHMDWMNELKARMIASKMFTCMTMINEKGFDLMIDILDMCCNFKVDCRIKVF